MQPSPDTQSQKQYPRNQVYSQSQKPQQFQQANRNSEQKSITNISGTSLAQLTYSPKSSKNTSPQLTILHQRIQYLQKQLQMLTQLLLQQQQKKQNIQHIVEQNKQLQQSLQKTQQINSLLQKQLSKSQKNNQQLTNALNVLNQQFQALKIQYEMKRDISDSKNSKSKQEVQQDIIHLNQEIANVLSKMHTLNQDYQGMREKNIRLEEYNKQLVEKIQNLQARIGEERSKYKQEQEYYKEQILLLKDQIKQVNQMSVSKQKQLYNQYSQKQRLFAEEMEQMRSYIKSIEQQNMERENMERENSQKKIRENEQGDSEGGMLVEIRNVRIRALQIDKEMLKRQLDNREQQIKIINNNLRNVERQLQQKSRMIEKMSQGNRDKLRNAQASYNSRITLLQSHIRDLKQIQQKCSALQSQTYSYQQQLRKKQQHIFELQTTLNSPKPPSPSPSSPSASHYQSVISQLQQQLQTYKSVQLQKNTQITFLDTKRKQVQLQLQSFKKKLYAVQQQVRNANEIKNRYNAEINMLKSKMKQLSQLSRMQQDNIRDIQWEHQNSRKKIEGIQGREGREGQGSKVDELKSVNRDLQANNKELEKLLINQKVEKDNQNKKYREVLEDYKQLNHQLTVELGLYRDASSPDHPHCPLRKDSSQSSFHHSIHKKPQPRPHHHHHIHKDRQLQKQLKRQLSVQRSKQKKLVQQHEKVLQKYKGIEIALNRLQRNQKQSQFLKIDNSSLRSQINQLNIRIKEYQDRIEEMRKDGERRNAEQGRVRDGLVREFQAKMEVQRMDIINQYNVLLRNRDVQLSTSWKPNQQPTRTPSYPAQQTRTPSYPQYLPQQTASFPTPYSPSYYQPPSSSCPIKCHPQFKKLQQQYISLHRKYLQDEQQYKKQITQYSDEIQKLRIQNQYHKKTIDQLQAQSYGIQANQDQYRNGNKDRGSDGYGRNTSGMDINLHDRREDAQLFRNKYQQLNSRYQKLYEQYVQLKSRASGTNQNTTRIRQLLRQPQPIDLSHLKQLLDSKMLQLQITPRQPSSTLERAQWFIQKMCALVQQLKNDRETLRMQKKQISKENDKLKVRVQMLEYQNGHNLKELAVAMEKFKYLEQKHMRLSELPSTEKKMANTIETQMYTKSKNKDQEYMGVQHKDIYNEQNQNNSNTNSNSMGSGNSPYGHTPYNGSPYSGSPTNEKDIHRHQAYIIREQRLNLLRKYQKDMERLDQDTQ